MNQKILDKLRFGKFEQKAIIQCPDDVKDFDGIAFDKELNRQKYDMVFFFVFSLEEFVTYLRKLIHDKILNPNGVAYFAYPKKGNKRYDTYIGRDDFFTVVDMDAGGYVDKSTVKFNKMVAFSEVFTVIGLKNEVQQRKSTQMSQCVDDYVEKIPLLEQCLARNRDALEKFRALTPGYQRGWARYVYGIKSQTTVDKHFEEMVLILLAGFKSIDLYRQNKK